MRFTPKRLCVCVRCVWGGLALIKNRVAPVWTFLPLKSRRQLRAPAPLLFGVPRLLLPLLPGSLWSTATTHRSLIREQRQRRQQQLLSPLRAGLTRRVPDAHSSLQDGLVFFCSPPRLPDALTLLYFSRSCSGSGQKSSPLCFAFSLWDLKRNCLDSYCAHVFGLRHGSAHTSAAFAVLFGIEFGLQRRRLRGGALWGQVGRILRADPEGADPGDPKRWTP